MAHASPLNQNTMARLDLYDIRPTGLDAYLSYYGYHFSPAMARWAVSLMTGKNGESVQFMDKNAVDNLLRQQEVDIPDKIGYDVVYVANMIKADRWGGSVKDESQLALAIRDEMEDPDGYEGQAFSRFLADCNGKGIPIIWEEMI